MEQEADKPGRQFFDTGQNPKERRRKKIKEKERKIIRNQSEKAARSRTK